MPYAVLVPVAEPVSGENPKKASLSVIGTPVNDPRARPQRDNTNNSGTSVFIIGGGGCASSVAAGGCSTSVGCGGGGCGGSPGGGCASGGCTSGGCAGGGCAGGASG
eukprot:CAMPEP_0170086526 /NCGR_PEP_ID=MMETSP0019_2-20121128/21182_1 /TAXON_ID=98059 /ORGANISM="Dinobryon sp., Strain UTEXLB2267" /LENGTH=106 /DNA_ID=CAMNT_0010303621 /DNA_START=226 /DNA_END=543 /DNA_ORIENTATION=-